MATDEDVRTLLQRLTPRPEVTVHVDLVRRRVRRRRSRTAVMAAALSVAVVVGGVSAVALRSSGDGPAPSERPSEPTSPDALPHAPGWHSLSAMPLSPRWGSLAMWTGDEFLVLGGYRQSHIGGPLPFPNLVDGAAFDPTTSAWRSVAAAPVALGEDVDATVVGDTLVVAHWERWLAYDIGDDEWRGLPDPPHELQQVSLAASTGGADDPYVVFALDPYVEESDAPVQVLDLASERWSVLPRSPHRPALDQRSMVSTPEGLVVIGEDYIPRQADRNETEDVHAELWDGRSWTRYGESDVRGCCWHWTGERVIATSRYDGMSGALDPATGDWSRLPRLPAGRPPRLLVSGWPEADGELAFGDGFLYDDDSRTSRPVPRPERNLGGGALSLGKGRLVMFGGYRVASGQEYSRVTPVEPTNEAWLYVPSS